MLSALGNVMGRANWTASFPYWRRAR